MQREQTNLRKEIPTLEMVEPLEAVREGGALQMYPQEERRHRTTENLLEEILSRDNMFKALDRVMKNKGAGGIDGMETDSLPKYLIDHWQDIRARIVEGKYKPSAVRKVEIPKDDGSKRMLGIPTVIDRLIQQAISQKLVELYDGGFSVNSYGFRPGRNTHQAVRKAKEYIEQGYEYIIDLDIEKFFDRVNHDYLMSRIARTILDKKLLLLIRRYLQSGIMDEGVVKSREEGMPQGSPLSPILSNILLDELDKELENRGHKFVRYADDCTIYAKTERASMRIVESIGRFIREKLKLKLNDEKSGIRRPEEIKILGFSFLKTQKGEWKIRVSKKSKKKLKRKVANITRRRVTISVAATIREINRIITGWGNYFKLTELDSDFKDINGWIRTRLRASIWHNWKKVRTRIRELKKLGISEDDAIGWGNTRKGVTRVANSPILKCSLTNAFCKRLGFKELALNR